MSLKLTKFDKLVTKYTRELNDDISNNPVFCIVTYTSLGLVALIMTILNMLTDKGPLTWVTAAFNVLCIINIFLTLLKKRNVIAVAKTLFAIGIVGVFTFFLISGNPEGFSAIWISMLPAIGMFFFGRRRGSSVCFLMFLILIFFLWTPFGNGLLQFQYSDSFKMRFPILFSAYHLLAFLLETLRASSFAEMKSLQQHYRELSIRDSLTGVLNRQGMYSALKTDPTYAHSETIGVAMFDIDHFKNINDEYGHEAGDIVLKKFAETIALYLNGIVCRWGGEEFVAIYVDEAVTERDLNNVRNAVSLLEFTSEKGNYSITTSIGLATECYYNTQYIDKLISKADEALYSAKRSGRNKLVNYKDL